jgi:hypothetical protein
MYFVGLQADGSPKFSMKPPLPKIVGVEDTEATSEAKVHTPSPEPRIYSRDPADPKYQRRGG